MNYKDYFKNKKIAIIGIGTHGEMITDIKFLLKNKALVSLYDMRSEARIKKYILNLSIAGLQKFSFGKIVDEELLDSDLIILSGEISKKSNFLKKAIQAGIQIEYPDSLFMKLSPPITLVGVLGSCGKSTVAHLIYGMFKKAFVEYKDQGLFFIDPDSANGALTHLKKIKKDDVVLSRIPEDLLDCYYEMHISPHVAVITTPISFKILEFQTYNNFIVATDAVIDSIKLQPTLSSKAKMLRVRAGSIPADWGIASKGVHNQENAALALQTGELFKVSNDIAKSVIQGFLGLRGHIELVKRLSGIEFYNDSASVTPQSTLVALRTLSTDKNIVLIFGGAYTGQDYGDLIKNISEYAHTVIFLPGSGSIGLREKIQKLENINFVQVLDLEQAVKESILKARKGDRVLFSPAFDAVGIDISRKERGERFVKAVRGL